MFSVVCACLCVHGGGAFVQGPGPSPPDRSVFSSVCLSVHREEGGPCTGPRSQAYLNFINLDLTVLPPPPTRYVEICSLCSW